MSNGKRIFTTAFKGWLVEQARSPGASVAGLVLRFGVNPNQLQRWIRLEHLRVEGREKAAILPVVLAPAAQPPEVPSAAPSAPIEIGGVRISAIADTEGACV